MQEHNETTMRAADQAQISVHLTVVTMAFSEETRPSGSKGPCVHHSGASSGGWHLPGLHVLHSGSRWKVMSLLLGSPGGKIKDSEEGNGVRTSM